MDSIVLSNWN